MSLIKFQVGPGLTSSSWALTMTFFPVGSIHAQRFKKVEVGPGSTPKCVVRHLSAGFWVKHKKSTFTFQDTKSQKSIFNIAFEVDLSKVDFSMTILRGQRKSRFLQPVYFRFRRSRSKTFRWRDRADLRKGFQKSKVRGPSSLNPSNRQKFKLIFEGFL